MCVDFRFRFTRSFSESDLTMVFYSVSFLSNYDWDWRYISCVFDLREEMSQKKAIVRNVKQAMYVIAISLGQDEHEIARPQSQRAFERRMNVKYSTKRPRLILLLFERSGTD